MNLEGGKYEDSPLLSNSFNGDKIPEFNGYPLANPVANNHSTEDKNAESSLQGICILPFFFLIF